MGPHEPPSVAFRSALEALAAAASCDDVAALVRAVDEAESARMTSLLRETYGGRWPHGFVWNEALWDVCAREVQKVRLVAYGPSFHKRFVGDSPSAFFAHAERPDEVLFAFHLAAPPLLWVPVVPSPGALRRLLSEHFPGIGASSSVRPDLVRALMGRPETLAVADPAGFERVASPSVLDRHWLVSPLVDEPCWGSAFPDDPFPARVEPEGMGACWETRTARGQRSGAVARLTRRTLFSGSELAVETHDYGDYVWHLRFRDNPYPGVIERLNGYLPTPLPTSLPVDLAGAVAGFAFVTEAELARRLEEDAPVDSLVATLRGLAAVRHSDLAVTETLRRYGAHPDLAVRVAVADLAVSYNWEFLLEDACIRGEPDDGLRSHLERLLDGVNPPPECSESGVSLRFLEWVPEVGDG